MKFIASDEGPRVLVRFIRKIVISDSVAVRRGFLALNDDGIIPGLMMNGFQGFQPLIPGVHDLLGNSFQEVEKWRDGMLDKSSSETCYVEIYQTSETLIGFKRKPQPEPVK